MMTDRAPDIADLEKMLNDAESDDALSSRAIEICERLREEIRDARQHSHHTQKMKLEAERLDFERVIEAIAARRHAHALDDYYVYVMRHGGPRDG